MQKKQQPKKKEGDEPQNMQRFDIELAKAIREGFKSRNGEPLVETVEYLYKIAKEVERLMKPASKMSAKDIFEKLEKQI
jgi:hypothetical protein